MNDYNNGVLPDPCLRLDYGFGEQWASVELGDGTGYVRLADYEKLESENAELRDTTYAWRTVDRLSCENAKLREQVTRLQDDWESERDYASQMEANEKKAVGENANLRELVDGLTWCCEHYSCRQECPLYDVSEPDHCREVSIKRELGIKVS